MASLGPQGPFVAVVYNAVGIVFANETFTDLTHYVSHKKPKGISIFGFYPRDQIPVIHVEV